jgi:hypothetical protein
VKNLKFIWPSASGANAVGLVIPHFGIKKSKNAKAWKGPKGSEKEDDEV